VIELGVAGGGGSNIGGVGVGGRGQERRWDECFGG
jgi:hypothetical protein